MAAVNSAPDPIAFLQSFAFEGPIDMVNLFRFREQARYPDHLGEGHRSGREAFALYVSALGPILEACGGCTPVWRGSVHFDITGGGTDTWDEMLVMRYPSRHALLRLLRSPEFAAIHHHRAAAISDSRTFICTAQA